MNKLHVTAIIVLLAGALTLAETPTTTKTPGEPAVSAAARQTARQRMMLRRESVKAMDAGPADEELDRAIRRLEAVRLTPKKAHSSSPSPSPAPTTQPAQPRSATSQPASPSSVAAAAASVAATTQPVARAKSSPLDKIRSLPAGSITDPVALADALYLAGRIEAAATFYEKGLETKLESSTRAWLLFQLGNCHKDSDPEAARGYYKRLLNEHTESIWKPAVVVADRLIEWKLTNKPEELLKTIARMTEK